MYYFFIFVLSAYICLGKVSYLNIYFKMDSSNNRHHNLLVLVVLTE